MDEKLFSDDNAMSYEYLIRRVHQCGRHGVAGADADTYRHFLRSAGMYYNTKKAIANNTERLWNQSEEKLLLDYMTKAGEITGYIRTALQKAMSKYETNFTDEQYQELEDVNSLLSKPSISIINEVIERADKVILAIGLYPK